MAGRATTGGLPLAAPLATAALMTCLLCLLHPHGAGAQFAEYGLKDAHGPVALHQLVVVPPGGDAIVTLRGYDLDGDPLKATVRALPSSSGGGGGGSSAFSGGGTVTQLSQVYSEYGYEPKKGALLTESGHGGTDVTGSKNRVYYSRPAADSAPYGAYGVMTYTVSDLSDANRVKSTSAEGRVTFVPPSGVLVGSSFSRGPEGWAVSGNRRSAGALSGVAHEASSRGGGLLNHYVYASDELINSAPASSAAASSASSATASGKGDDQALWYFAAPAKFLGHWGVAYGGRLRFTLGAFSGDFHAPNTRRPFLKAAAAPADQGLHLVEMHCAQCDLNRGVTLAFPLASAWTTTTTGGGGGPPLLLGSGTQFTLPLTEKGGWLVDPKNTLQAWSKPSQCTMIEVLSGLSSLKILGDFTQWYESVALDEVALVNLKAALPLCAQASQAQDGSQCTCSPDAYSNTVV